MPQVVTYEIKTVSEVVRLYKVHLTLPVDMGDATPRLTDRMIRTAVADGSIDLNDKDLLGDPIESDETVTSVTRDGKVVTPRPHKKPAAKKAQIDLEDIVVEDAMSADTES